MTSDLHAQLIRQGFSRTADTLETMETTMPTLNLSTASAWDIGQFLESERQRGMDDYLDDREPEEPLFDEED